MSRSVTYSKLNRHMEPKLQGVRLWTEEGRIAFQHIGTDLNIVDSGTKPETNARKFDTNANLLLGMTLRGPEYLPVTVDRGPTTSLPTTAIVA